MLVDLHLIVLVYIEFTWIHIDLYPIRALWDHMGPMGPHMPIWPWARGSGGRPVGWSGVLSGGWVIGWVGGRAVGRSCGWAVRRGSDVFMCVCVFMCVLLYTQLLK